MPRRLIVAALLLPLAVACRRGAGTPAPAADEHAGHDAAAMSGAAAATAPAAGAAALPAGADEVAARLAASPRHGEWQVVRMPDGDSVRAWVVYPERRDKAPVVLVIHEIFGLSTWVRGVADQLAADGFVAVAPDLITGKVAVAAGDTVAADAARAAIAVLDRGQALRRTTAVARWATALPAANGKYGIVGFCWGGTMVFAQAASDPQLGAGVPYYGGAPAATIPLANVRAPLLAHYASDDARVNMTIPGADSIFRTVGGMRWEKEIHQGAGHGFLRQQSGREGANLAASRASWPRTVAWFRQHLEAR